MVQKGCVLVRADQREPTACSIRVHDRSESRLESRPEAWRRERRVETVGLCDSGVRRDHDLHSISATFAYDGGHFASSHDGGTYPFLTGTGRTGEGMAVSR